MKISILLRLIDKAGPGSICPIAHHKHQCESAEFETRPFVVKALDVLHCCFTAAAKHTFVGFIYTFWYSLSSASSILEQRLQSVNHLQLTSSEGFRHHFNIISKFVCCGCYMKNICFEKNQNSNIHVMFIINITCNET